MRAELSTGDLARATGNTLRTIRFYEEEGLLKPAEVSDGGHRRYTEEELEKLRLISDLRELGLSLGEIRAVLDTRAGCKTASEFADRLQNVLVGHIEQAQKRLERLRRVKKELTDALCAIREHGGDLGDRCPCMMAHPHQPRIVKVVAAQSQCDHSSSDDHVGWVQSADE